MYKTRLDRLERTIILQIVRDFYYFAADTLPSPNDMFESLLEEINGPSKQKEKAIEQYNRLSIEDLREFDPNSPRLRKFEDKKKMVQK